LGVKCRFARAFDGLSPQYEPHHKGRFDKTSRPAACKMQKARRKVQAGRLLSMNFVRIYTPSKRQMSMRKLH
jgi:hypothetical protein